jgi:hypothetical protein
MGIAEEALREALQLREHSLVKFVELNLLGSWDYDPSKP